MTKFKKSTVWFWFWLIIELALTPFLFFPFIFAIIHIIKYSTNYISFDDKEIVCSTGLLNRKVDEVRFSKINSIKTARGAIGQMFGYGDIIIVTGSEAGAIVFKDLDNPDKLKAILKEKMDAAEK
jgi:uncharacterized membrane protein YdbT with pleckstrin-like domain